MEVAQSIRHRHKHGLLCKFQNEYSCSKISKQLWLRLSLPPNACFLHDCSECLIVNQTFVMDKSLELVKPTSFILRSTKDVKDALSTAYTCSRPDTRSCECDNDLCYGTPDFCKLRSCNNQSDCQCDFTYEKTELVAILPETLVTNPDILVLDICYFDKRLTHKSNAVSRKLLEGEKASFTEGNLTFTFDDPILNLPGDGRVILRSTEFEHVMSVPDDRMIQIPFEYLAYKSDIIVTYLHSSGKVVMGEIHVTGKDICKLRHCLFCSQILTHFKCYPSLIQYAFYILFGFIVIILLLCVKLVFKCLKFVFSAFIMFMLGAIRIFKFIARCSLLLGAFIGSTIREISNSCYAALERNAVQRANMNMLPLVLLIFTCIFTTVNTDCSSNTIIKSDLKSCEVLNDGSKNCQIFTTAEITLKSISAENCLWFSDENDNHLFTIKIRLDDIVCSFTKERLYFTFPVTTKQISQISCIFNRFCGRGYHCKRRVIGRQGIHFEAESEESRQFPGFSGCVGGNSGNGCLILTRPSCNFHRIWYEPDLLNSFEVSKLTGHKCEYRISVLQSENNTVSRLLISDSAYTPNGIKISILGSYDQPQLYINEKLVQRVGRPEEAYLVSACERNIPQPNMIGSIQANSSYTTDFIFSPELTTCDYFEDNLRCLTAPDSVARLRASQEYALPLQKHIHLFHIEDEKLKSTQLLSSAVRVQLHFRNYKIALQTSTVCPQFDEKSITVTGCYNCALLSRLSFQAHSSCQPGLVTVQLQEISVHTKAIFLSLESSEHIIKFQAERKCATEKLCLKSATLKQCNTFKYCLEEPSVELLALNTNYTRSVSLTTSSTFWDWLQLPNMGSSLFFLKLIGSALFIVCLLITTFATLITCCCRAR